MKTFSTRVAPSCNSIVTMWASPPCSVMQQWQKQPWMFLFEPATWFSQNQNISQILSSGAAFASRQSKMNFSGVWKKNRRRKKEKNPANSNLCNTQLHIQSGRSVKPPLPTAGHCHWSRAHTGGQTLVSYHSSVCLPAVTGVNTE